MEETIKSSEIYGGDNQKFRDLWRRKSKVQRYMDETINSSDVQGRRLIISHNLCLKSKVSDASLLDRPLVGTVCGNMENIYLLYYTSQPLDVGAS